MKLPWPVPALLAWAMAWALVLLLGHGGWPLWQAALAAALPLSLIALRQTTTLRAGVISAGYAGSVLMLAATSGALFSVPAWTWLMLCGTVLLIYPLKAWRGAPLYPTPPNALRALPQHIPEYAGMVVMDAGCGTGHGLMALRQAFPRSQIVGLEWSLPLLLWSRIRCPWAQIHRVDLWRHPWNSASVVYLFQRVDVMEAAYKKGLGEMAAGSWLVSLEFAVPGVRAQVCIPLKSGQCVWLYRMPGAGQDSSQD